LHFLDEEGAREEAWHQIIPQVVEGRMMDDARRIELERADAARQALEEAAQRVESQEGGETYRKAFKAAADLLRRFKATL
jgi:hypothetical protein